MYVYILTNVHRTVLYVGVTSDISRRVAQHRAGKAGAFTARYRCTRLVYVEVVHGQLQAITREKQLKSGSRARKIRLIESVNPEWRDLLPSV